MSNLIIIILVILVSSIFYILLKKKTPEPKNIFNAEYYRGLNYLLNNEEDKAFKIFTSLMDVDSSTIETHLALGGLYRKRGEFDKAILIHQNLLSRPTLVSELRNQALYELAKDFYSAGLYDRAEKIFNDLSENKIYRQSALEYLLIICEVTKDWNNAIDYIKIINSDYINNISSAHLLAQYYCEISEQYNNDGQLDKALAISKKALKVNSECIRANFQLADYYSDNDINFSIQYYMSIISQDSKYAPYIVEKILNLGKKVNNSIIITDAISMLSKNPTLSFIPAIFSYLYYNNSFDVAKKYVATFDLSDPSTEFHISHALAKVSSVTDKSDVLSNLSKAYENVFSNKLLFLCVNCGYKSTTMNWQCPSCNKWESIAPASLGDIIDSRNIND